MRARHLLTALIAVAIGGASCGPKTGTRLEPVSAQTATVGVELSIMLRAASGGRVDFTYSSDLDLATRSLKPTLTPFANGEALFSWTPLASDVGQHQLRFSAAVNGVVSTLSVPVSVISGDDPISFREPVGEGTTLDPSRASCASVSVLVDDTSATRVTLAPGATWPDGATLTGDGPLSGSVRFCPTAAQLAATSIFPLTLTASDGGGAHAEKRYVIVIGTLPPKVTPPPPPDDMLPLDLGAGDMSAPACDTTTPAIVHTPHANLTSTGNPHISAELSSTAQIADAAVYWSTLPPADASHPDLTAMTRIDMLLLSGTYSDGQFGATIPSPVAGSAPGTRSDIYYVIVATDGADGVAGCSAHTSMSPMGAVDHFVITEAN